MKWAGIAVVIGFLLVACNGSESSERSGRSRQQATTTTAAPARLEWATPDGYRYGFRVADRKIEAVANPGFATAVATIEITNLLDRQDSRVNLPQATDRRLMLAIRQERFGGVCPDDFNDPYDYKIYVAASGYCVITSSAITSDYGLPGGPNQSATVSLTVQVATSLSVEAADLGVFFFDPLLSLTPVLEVVPEGATYGANRSPDCGNPASGELRPECEAAFHPDLLVPLP
jgi:hypothetical protein